MNEEGEKAKPNVIDSLLYETKTLKSAVIDNYVESNEGRPLMEFREVMKANAREFAKAFVKDHLQELELTEEEIKKFESRYYGD